VRDRKSGRSELNLIFCNLCEPEDRGGTSDSREGPNMSRSNVEVWSIDGSLGGKYSSWSWRSVTGAARTYDDLCCSMPCVPNGPCCGLGSSRPGRNIFDKVVRDRCSAVGLDEPASLKSGVVEECNMRDSLLLLFDRIGWRGCLWLLSKPPASSLLLTRGSAARSSVPKDDLRR
jgi:hypothetical protein